MAAEHIIKSYDEELSRLNKMIVEMGGLAESQLATAIEAVVERDSELGASVVEGDARVDPMHARKLAAALQHATSASPEDRPILLRRELGVGHAARAVSRSVSLWLDQLGFFARQLGLGTD